MQENSKLCIIPARGGSKRIPRKNIMHIAGKPLVNHSVDVALKSGLFDDVVVSTEDKEIQRIVSPCASIHKRSEAFAGDHIRLTEVCKNLLDELKQNGKHYDVFCLLQPACPLRTIEDLIKSYELLTSEVNYVISVSEFDDPPFWALYEDPNGCLQLCFGNKYLKPRQELPKIYRHNGSIVWARSKLFLKEGEFLGNSKSISYKMPLERSLEADYPYQLQFIEQLLEEKSK